MAKRSVLAPKFVVGELQLRFRSRQWWSVQFSPDGRFGPSAMVDAEFVSSLERVSVLAYGESEAKTRARRVRRALRQTQRRQENVARGLCRCGGALSGAGLACEACANHRSGSNTRKERHEKLKAKARADALLEVQGQWQTCGGNFNFTRWLKEQIEATK